MLEVTTPGEPVHRVGYAPDPWTWVPWEYVDRATGRWDDPEGNYRVLYAGTSPEACFVEVLSPFRPDPSLDADMSAINGDPRDARYPSVPAGTVDASWLDRRRLGRARLTGTYVDVTHKNTIAELRASLLHRAVAHGLSDLDASAIRTHQPRAFTREISRHLYTVDHEGKRLDGIAYESRFGAGLALWAVFERADDSGLDTSRLIGDRDASPIPADHPDLVAALELHNLTFS